MRQVLRAVPEGGQHHEGIATRSEMLRQTRGEALRDVDRSPGAIGIAARRTEDERWIEQDHIEPPALHWREQVSLQDFDPVFHRVEQRVDPGTAHRDGIDIDCAYPARQLRRSDGAYT